LRYSITIEHVERRLGAEFAAGSRIIDERSPTGQARQQRDLV
jgi:hypothetical protein